MNKILFSATICSIFLLGACSKTEEQERFAKFSPFKQKFIHACIKPIRTSPQMKPQIQAFCECTFDDLVVQLGNEENLASIEKSIGKKDKNAIEKLQQATLVSTKKCQLLLDKK